MARSQKSDTKSQQGSAKSQWNSTTTYHASGFWDSLSKIHLTHHALQEFNRRDLLRLKSAVRKDSASGAFTSDLRRFSRTGGPDLSDIMECPQPFIPVILHRHSAYESNFMTKLAKRNITRPKLANSKPANFKNLQDKLKTRRASLSPSNFPEDRFESLLNSMENALDESTVMSDVFSKIKGDHTYPSTQNRQCRNWKPLVDANMVTPQPDFFDGVRITSKYRQIQEVLGSLIIPSTSDDCPFLPNFLGEVKAPKGSMDIAKRQACYDGAFGARAMHHLRNYGAEETYNNHAYTFTFTYSYGVLELCAHHMSQPDEPNTPPYYHMTKLGAWLLQTSRQQFAEGATAFRNLRDLARELREQFLDDADQRMQGVPKDRRTELIAEAIERAQKALPNMQDFENVICKPQLQSSQTINSQDSQASSNEVIVDRIDAVVASTRLAAENGSPKHKATLKARRNKTPEPNYKLKTSTKVQKKSTSKAKAKSKPRANKNAKTRQDHC